MRAEAKARVAIVLACLTAASAISLAGCKHSGSARLEGHWKGTRADGVSGEAQSAANAFATQTEIDVKGDVITVVTPKEHQAGKYKVVKDEKMQVVIITDKDGADDAQTFTFVDDKTMKWSVLEGKTITFVKE